MLALFLMLAQTAPPPADLVAPRAAEGVELREVHDTTWILPSRLPLAKEPARELAVELGARMRELLAQRWDVAEGAPRCVGDFARAWRRASGSEREREALWTALRALKPPLASDVVPLLSELLADDALRARDWDPERDDARDGIAFARPMTLEGCQERPWARLEGSHLLQQACVFVFADLDALKAAENDYRAYPARAGASYESIHPVRDSYVRGVDAHGREFAALRLKFRCDLPFPFDDYRCELAILNRIDADGTARCDIHSTSRDFLWLAGDDVYLPVLASDGELVATCVVRRFGFDLRGVPDGDDARRTGLRSSLGNLKLESEARQRARGDGLRRSAGQLPRFDVRGGR